MLDCYVYALALRLPTCDLSSPETLSFLPLVLMIKPLLWAHGLTVKWLPTQHALTIAFSFFCLLNISIFWWPKSYFACPVLLIFVTHWSRCLVIYNHHSSACLCVYHLELISMLPSNMTVSIHFWLFSWRCLPQWELDKYPHYHVPCQSELAYLLPSERYADSCQALY